MKRMVLVLVVCYAAFQAGRVKTFTMDIPDAVYKTLLTLTDISPSTARRPAPTPARFSAPRTAQPTT